MQPGRDARYLRWLFLETCRDVALRSRYGVPHSAYEALLLGFLLRKLFLDDTPLVQRVRQLHPTRLEFTVVPWAPAWNAVPAIGSHGRPLLHWAGDCFDPGTPCKAHPHGPPETVLSADALMKVSIGAVGNQRLTVHDLVRSAANALGGVHVGRSRSSKDEYLKSAMMAVAGSPSGDLLAPVHVLRAVGRTALAGLAPLMEQADSAG